MAGTQGSSYSSSDKAAAANRATTSNLKSGLNASGSSKTNSGYGNTAARASVNAAAASAARMAAERAAATRSYSSAASRNMSSGAGASLGGFGSMRQVAERIAADRSPSSNAAAKSDLPGIGQSFGRGTNYSAADYTMAGYGAYKNPNATQRITDGQGRTIASLAAPRQNITTVQKGVNLSPADMLAGGYGQYQRAPSAQSTPQTATGGWNDLANIQRTLGQFQPSFGGIVSGLSRSPFAAKVAGTPGGEIGSVNLGPNGIPEQQLMNAGYGPAPSQIARVDYGQTPIAKDISRVPSMESPTMTAAAGYQGYNPLSSVSTPQTAAASPPGYNWNGSPNVAAANAAAMNQPMNVNYEQKVAMQGIPGAPSLDSVPNLPNYASPVSVAAREPEGYTSPNAATTEVAGYQNPARAYPSISRPAPPQSAMVSPMAGQGQTFRSPASAAQYNQAMGGLLAAANNQVASASPAASDDPGAIEGNPLYDGDSTPQQKLNAALETRFERIADPALKAGEYVNGLLGGSPYNDLYGRPGMTDPNVRDQMNNLAEKGADKTSGRTDMRGLSEEQRDKVREYMKQGMSRKEAIKKVKAEAGGSGSGTGTGGGTQTASLYYPQYYSAWAGLPSGQKYG